MINWDKPKKVRSTKEHNEMHSSDCGVNGTYVPNMSREDAQSWRGKHINKGKDTARIELRKTFNVGTNYANVLIVLTSGNMTISTNGTIEMSIEDWFDLKEVVSLASLTLRNNSHD